MGRQDGSMYECDRCGVKEFMTPDSPARSDWIDVERMTADGRDKHALMCPSCYALYKEIVAQNDRTYNKFMAEGVAK